MAKFVNSCIETYCEPNSVLFHRGKNHHRETHTAIIAVDAIPTTTETKVIHIAVKV